MLISYFDYCSVYRAGTEGVIDAALFPFYSKRAEAFVNSQCFGRLNSATKTDEIISAICEVAESMYNEDQETKAINNNEKISSEKVGEWSVSYQNASQKTKEEYRNERQMIIQNYLSDTDLLYMGVEM